MKAQISFKVPVTIFKEGKAFIAYSPVLDLSTSAKSFGVVKRRFEEAVQIFFEELVGQETLDDVLTNLGWSRIDKNWTPPLPISHETTTISIPLKN